MVNSQAFRNFVQGKVTVSEIIHKTFCMLYLGYQCFF